MRLPCHVRTITSVTSVDWVHLSLAICPHIIAKCFKKSFDYLGDVILSYNHPSLTAQQAMCVVLEYTHCWPLKRTDSLIMVTLCWLRAGHRLHGQVAPVMTTSSRTNWLYNYSARPLTSPNTPQLPRSDEAIAIQSKSLARYRARHLQEKVRYSTSIRRPICNCVGKLPDARIETAPQWKPWKLDVRYQVGD